MARPSYTAVKGVKCPEMMLTMTTKATLQSYRHKCRREVYRLFCALMRKRLRIGDCRILFATKRSNEILCYETYRLINLVLRC